MNFPKISTAQLLKRLEPPKASFRMVLDTDTFNEIDDQFAVVYALLSEKMKLEAFYAAPFFNEMSEGPKDGMEKSYAELHKIVSLMKRKDVPIYKGSEGYLSDADTPVNSAAAADLVKRAMASSEDDPLYVVAIGAITNVASAILMKPEIIERIVVVWLGGHSLHWGSTKEFNLFQDLHATRTILNCGVPLVLLPCGGMATHLTTSLPELREHITGTQIGNYLVETYQNCTEDHVGTTRVIWDIATIAFLNNSEWTSHALVHSPLVSEDFRWSEDRSRHLIRYVEFIQRDAVFKDLFAKVRGS